MSGSLGAVVVSYESAEDLPGCLEALGHATGVGRFLVVDNASRDNSVEVAWATSGVEVVEETVNSGFAGGCNRGYRELAGEFEWLAFLNPDVQVLPDCLQRCVQALAADSRLAGVAPLLMRPDGRTVDSAGQMLHPLTLEVRDLGYGKPATLETLKPRAVLAPCGALAVFRRAALEEVSGDHGPWAQDYFCFWEDLELGWRLLNAGWRIRTVPDAVATHRRGGGAPEGTGPLRWRRPPELEACILSNRWMTLIRHLHPLDLLPRLPLLLLWDSSLVAAGAARRGSLLGHLRRRWPMVMTEWHGRRRSNRRRLREVI
ncbi:MAG: glycosyltransferase family 2 protein [Thermoanaerobaculales bacterium]